MSIRSPRACGVKLTFKIEVAPNLFDRDHRGAVAALRKATLDLRALPCVIARLDGVFARVGCLAM